MASDVFTGFCDDGIVSPWFGELYWEHHVALTVDDKKKKNEAPKSHNMPQINTPARK